MLEGFVVSKVGLRSRDIQVRISKKTKLIYFNVAFTREYFLKKRPQFLRQLYSKEQNKIAVEFFYKNVIHGELNRIWFYRDTICAYITPILINFNLKIGDIGGAYKDNSLVKYNDTTFILDVNTRIR